jgi:hypothetical protein
VAHRQQIARHAATLRYAIIVIIIIIIVVVVDDGGGINDYDDDSNHNAVESSPCCGDVIIVIVGVDIERNAQHRPCACNGTFNTKKETLVPSSSTHRTSTQHLVVGLSQIAVGAYMWIGAACVEVWHAADRTRELVIESRLCPAVLVLVCLFVCSLCLFNSFQRFRQRYRRSMLGMR